MAITLDGEWSDALCEAFARAYDAEDAAQRGEPSPWEVDDPAAEAAA